MLNLGAIEVDKTIYIPFATYGADGESITATGLITSDIKIYKDGIDQDLTNSNSGTVGTVAVARNGTIGASWNDASTQSQFYAGDIDDVPCRAGSRRGRPGQSLSVRATGLFLRRP